MNPKHYVLTLLAAIAMSTTLMAGDLKTEMERLQTEHDINFVYDSSLDLSTAYTGASLQGRGLDEALSLLFANSPIVYRIEGSHVLLMRRDETTKEQRWTVNGYVTEENGEPMIYATVYDATARRGTTTNEHGFYSLTLPEGRHQLNFSYVGYEPQTISLLLNGNVSRTIRLRQQQLVLNTAEVKGDLNSPLLTTQTGRRTLRPQDLNTEFSLFSSPDVVKTLQMQSGVAQGIELVSGLYVHGGGTDENLFLLDGTPLYQTNHLLGVFSSFNTDVVKHVDFYKSGFPARYGGRLSSVVDVRTADGDMQHWHGLYSLGLIDGRFQIEGPIKKDRTSLNIGLRRTWSDLVTRPIMAIYNHHHKDESVGLAYFFHDLNAKLTHRLDARNTLQLSFYSGTDRLDMNSRFEESYDWDEGHSRWTGKDKGYYAWGNDNLSADWKHIFSPRLYAYFSATYSHNRACYSVTNNDENFWKGNDTGDDYRLVDKMYTRFSYRSTIDDVSLRTDFDLRPSPVHHIRFGGALAGHYFKPQTRSVVAVYGQLEDPDNRLSDTSMDTLRSSSHNHQPAYEMNLYGEDELRLNDRWSVNGGLHAELFNARHKTYVTLDPRVAMKYQLADNVSVKAGYTWMTQQMHRLQNTYIDLPTDYWVPTTQRVPPMRSQQWSLGVYAKPHRYWMLLVEGYLKRSQHLLQYVNWIGLEPPADSWDRVVEQGEGRSRGVDVDVAFDNGHVSLKAAYTLAKTERRFRETYDGWFPDKFDNRHKLYIVGRFRWKHSEMYAAWTYHTGNRITLPEHYAALPYLPNGSSTARWMDSNYFYSTPNNAQLPDYHRLDLGWNFHHTTKAGHERIWNISVYNAYCRLNPIYAEVHQSSQNQFKVKSVGFVPIIPSVSYTIKF